MVSICIGLSVGIVGRRIDADVAIAKGKAILGQLGAKDLSLVQVCLLEKRLTHVEDCWWMSFDAKNRGKLPCTTEVRARDGAVIRAEFGDWTLRSGRTEHWVNNSRIPDPLEPKAKQFALDKIRQLAPTAKAKFESLNFGKPMTVTQFDLMVGGKRFFNFNPHVGYVLHTNLETWKVIRFAADIDYPPVDSRAEIVGEQAARAIAKESLKTNSQYIHDKDFFANSGPVTAKISTEPGYFKVAGEATSRKVWMAKVSEHQDRGKYGVTTLQTLHIMVDAVTGKLVPYTDRGSKGM